MIVKETNGTATKIYSDRGLKILQVETGRVYSVAYEAEGGKRFSYEEVEGE